MEDFVLIYQALWDDKKKAYSGTGRAQLFNLKFISAISISFCTEKNRNIYTIWMGTESAYFFSKDLDVLWKRKCDQEGIE